MNQTELLTEKVRTSDPSATGHRHRVGGIGQAYEIIARIDDNTVLIHTVDTSEKLPYPTEDAARDARAAGHPDMDRFSALVGQYRTIGSDGPTYEVMSVQANGSASIWMLASEDEDEYSVENILLDPMAPDIAA